ncbi:MAG: DUF3299 domain-containing protein [Pseudomonadota bacterium]
MINMNRVTTALFRSVVAAGLLGIGALANAAKPLELMWEDLMPANNVFSFSDDTQSNEPALSSHVFGVQQTGAVVPELNGKRVKIPAFVVPLDGDEDSLTELLLVPYFGACIHVPPPPSNQIIYYNSEKSSVDVESLDLYRPVWATGTLITEETAHDLAQIGYRMDIEFLEEYKLN